MAVANGIERCVTTPHIQPGLYDNDADTIRTGWEAFRHALADNAIPLELGMAAEVRIDPDIMPMLMEGRIPFLGEWQGEKVLLLELPHSHIPPGSDKLVKWFQQQGIRPMIAHPERNKDILRDFSKLTPFVQLGCLFQVTAGSVAGNFGPQARERAEQILRNGWATILASDGHNLAHRPPELETGRQAAARLIGEEASWQLVRDNPGQVIAETFPWAA